LTRKSESERHGSTKKRESESESESERHRWTRMRESKSERP